MLPRRSTWSKGHCGVEARGERQPGLAETTKDNLDWETAPD